MLTAFAAAGGLVAAVALDGVVKRWAARSLPEKRLAPGVAVALVLNPAETAARVSRVLALAGGATAVGVAAAGGRATVAVSLALALGGAVANELDRVRRGAVLDCFSFAGRLAFNPADVAITVGIAGALAALIAGAM